MKSLMRLPPSSVSQHAVSFEIMRNEPAGVFRDRGIVFADSDAACTIVHDPCADDRVVSLETRERRVFLEDVSLLAVGSARHERAGVAPQADVGALPGEDRFPDVIGSCQGSRIEIARQKVRVLRKQFPENREDRLVGKQHLPGRLDPGAGLLQDARAESLPRQPFPRIELEQGLDGVSLQVDEAGGVCAPADVLDEYELRGEAPLDRRIAEVMGVAEVLFMFTDTREIERLRTQRTVHFPPPLDELLVQRVELIGALAYRAARGGFQPLAVFQPEPLRHARFDERGRRIGVVLQKLGRPLAVPGEIEPAEDGGIPPFPGVADVFGKSGRNRELAVAPVAHDLLACLQAKTLQFLGGGLQDVDLFAGKDIAGRFFPIPPAERMKGEADVLAAALPVRPGWRRAASHAAAPAIARSSAAAVERRRGSKAAAADRCGADRPRTARRIGVRAVARTVPDARRSDGARPVSGLAVFRTPPVLLALFGTRIHVPIGVARSAVAGGQRGRSQKDYADAQTGFPLAHGPTVYERFHGTARRFSFRTIISCARRAASSSFSIPSTASRNCAARLRLSAWAASFSNLATTCASLAKFGSLPRGVSTARSRRLPSLSITSTRTLWRYFAPFALISGSGRTSIFSASAMRRESATIPSLN